MERYIDVASYIEALKLLVKANSDSELAKKIGLTKSNIANWRRRNKVPLSVEDRLTDEFGPEAAYSNFMRSTSNFREGRILYGFFSYIQNLKWSETSYANDPEYTMKWGQALASMENQVREAIRALGFDYLRQQEVLEITIRMYHLGDMPEVDKCISIWVSGDYEHEDH